MRKELTALAVLTLWFLPAFTMAESRNQEGDQPKKIDQPIDHFAIDNDGLLHLSLHDGSHIIIQKERGRNAIGDQILEQQEFVSVQLAENHDRIGWLASYMLCAQSYPCTTVLTVLNVKKGVRYIAPPIGIIWRWMFTDRGRKVVLQYGFPHGDYVGAYALYDADSGDKKDEYPGIHKTIPKWVQELQSRGR